MFARSSSCLVVARGVLVAQFGNCTYRNLSISILFDCIETRSDAPGRSASVPPPLSHRPAESAGRGLGNVREISTPFQNPALVSLSPLLDFSAPPCYNSLGHSKDTGPDVDRQAVKWSHLCPGGWMSGAPTGRCCPCSQGIGRPGHFQVQLLTPLIRRTLVSRSS